MILGIGEQCAGLSVFWLANIANYVHDNAAVGGHSGLWVFTHSGSAGYRWDAIPKDPVTGIREWRNNKASACNRGFVMDEGVKVFSLLLTFFDKQSEQLFSFFRKLYKISHRLQNNLTWFVDLDKINRFCDKKSWNGYFGMPENNTK